MKKIHGLISLFCLICLPTLAWAQLSEDQRWIEAADGGFVFPVSPAVSNVYERGLGGDILVGYRFNRDISLSADVGYYECDEKFLGGSAGQWTYSPVLALARFNMGEGTVRPFLILGAGMAFNSYSLTTSYAGKPSNRGTDPLLAPGAGILFIVEPNTAIYAEARMDMDFSTPGGPWMDNPTIFLPVKAGVSFFAF